MACSLSLPTLVSWCWLIQVKAAERADQVLGEGDMAGAET
jgi:hypothetical protein